MKIKLTIDQYKISAEIAGNIATAWFAVGVIAPFFVKPESLFFLVASIISGLSMTGVFAWLALILVEGNKK